MSDMDSYNIVKSLFQMAESQPDTMAIAIPKYPGKPLPKDGSIDYDEINYETLAKETNRISGDLLKAGYKPGDRVVLMVPPGIEFITISFAFLQSGLIPVLIDPGIGLKNLKECIGESNPSGFVGISKAHIARIFLGWGRKSIKIKTTLGPRYFWGGKRLKGFQKKEEHSSAASREPEQCFSASSDDLAAILFTSGSTGVPKGVMYTHGNFFHQVQSIRNTFGMQPGEVDLPTFAPFALFNPTSGVSTVIADMNPTKPAEVDPERIIRAIHKYKVTNMFGSPALIDRVGRYVEANNIKSPSLKRVLSAGAPVPSATLERFATMLNDDVQILTPYGATEAMPITSIGSHELLTEDIQKRTKNGDGICIGKPVQKIDIRIIKITDDPIEHWSDDLKVNTGEVGEIVVKGDNVTRSYFNNDNATNRAKIIDGNTFWHRMGDLGYQDDEGNFWFCGRKSHRVKLANKELYTIQCEGIFNQHPKVFRTALVGTDQGAVLCVETEKNISKIEHDLIKKELQELALSHHLEFKSILFHPAFPVDIRHNAKIFREKLSIWAQEQLNQS